MRKKTVMDMNKFPCGRASGRLTQGCIVLEGGALRGTYTDGVLDALMENDINMQTVIGVSAGAMNGMSYVSGQIGRAMRTTVGYRHNSRYMGAKAIRESGGLFGFEFMFGELLEIDKFDTDTFFGNDVRFVAVATNCLTGEPEYFEKDFPDIIEAVKASGSLPLVSKPVTIGGVEYFDGGCSCKIPYRWAIDNDYQKILIVRTRHSSYRKDLSKKNLSLPIIEKKFKKYPELIKSVSESDKNYNAQCDEIDELEKSGRVFVISPSETVEVGRFEGNLDKLSDLYHMGYIDTLKKLSDLRKYLEI